VLLFFAGRGGAESISRGRAGNVAEADPSLTPSFGKKLGSRADAGAVPIPTFDVASEMREGEAEPPEPDLLRGAAKKDVALLLRPVLLCVGVPGSGEVGSGMLVAFR
jgi:hypothetical protein